MEKVDHPRVGTLPDFGNFKLEEDKWYDRYKGMKEIIGEEKRSINSNNFANEEEIWNVLHTCYDPEIPVNIVDLGLVYNTEIKEEEDGVNISIQMTLTAPGCGMGPVIADEVKQKLSSLSGAKEVEVELVWEPQWNQDMMSDAAKLQLGLY